MAALDMNCNASPWMSGIYPPPAARMVIQRKLPAIPCAEINIGQRYLYGIKPMDTKYVLLVDGQIISGQIDAQQISELQENIHTPSDTLAKHLDQIKENLALSVTQMAELFGIPEKQCTIGTRGLNLDLMQ